MRLFSVLILFQFIVQLAYCQQANKSEDLFCQPQINFKNYFYSNHLNPYHLQRDLLKDSIFVRSNFPLNLQLTEISFKKTPQFSTFYLPHYKEGFFCNFEDYINKQRKFRIDFGTD